MVFGTELYDRKKHYEMLKGWWDKHNWTAPTKEMLPNLGVLVFNRETGHYTYAAFLYLSDSAFAWIEYIVSNPDLNKYPSLKKGALDEAIRFLCEAAKKTTRGKAKVVFTSTNNEALVNSLKKSNFEVGDRNVTQLIKLI